jgi:hypothetical protein
MPSKVGTRAEAVMPSALQSHSAHQAANPPQRAESNGEIEVAIDIDFPATQAPAGNAGGHLHNPGFSPSFVLPESRQAEDELPDTLRPSHADLAPALSPALGKRRRSRSLFATAATATALIALASVIGLVTGKITPSDALDWLQRQRAAVTASPTAETTGTPATPPTAAATATATADTTATPATSGDAPKLADSSAPSPSGTAETVAVTVRVSPPDAVVSKDGRPVGTREVTLNVVSGTTTVVVAQLRGYVTNTVAIDGTKKSVDIVMIPWKSTAPATQAATPQRDVQTSPALPGEPSGGVKWDPSGI